MDAASRLCDLLEVDLPVVQAPMAGCQDHALALAVSAAGGLGSLACATLDGAALEAELAALSAAGGPVALNFFCHAVADPDPAREAAWRAWLAPFYAEYDIDPAAVAAGPVRAAFDAATWERVAPWDRPICSARRRARRPCIVRP